MMNRPSFGPLLMFAGTIALSFLSITAYSQEAELLAFERNIEKSVVETNIPFLQKAYADDFRFKHGTGLVDSKASWIKGVEGAKGKFISRIVDSVEVEIHDKGGMKIGVTNGKITITRKTDKADRVYMIKYVRVYVKKDDNWELIMHRTVHEKTLSE